MRHSYDPDLARLTTPETSVAYLTEGYAPEALPLIKEAVMHVWPLREHDTVLPDPFAVAALLKELGADSDCVVATLYGSHRARVAISKDALPAACTPRQRQLIEGVRWLNSFSSDGGHLSSREDDRLQQAERVRQLLLVMIEDVRALLIKLAFRVLRLQVLLKQNNDTSGPVARETLEIYAPLANRLGVAQLKWQLEDLSFRIVEPDTYKRIARSLEERREDREKYITSFVETLSVQLEKAGIDNFEVKGRPKHLYSIWKKMQRKRVEVTDLYDVRAVRVLVDNLQQCYAALGVVHTGWQHLPREFDDYIANPKENGYQSLHTAVIGPKGKALEVQIRSRGMDADAELGVAAHWRYKEGSREDTRLQKSINSLRSVLDNDGETAEQLLDVFDSEVFSDRVYVFTPKGAIVDLPNAATPLDFAYHVHTEVGHRCRGAKVNGRIVQLTQKLRNGDQVEILTGKNSNPSRDWMNRGNGFLHTSRARSKVRAWFNVRDQEVHLEDGRQIVERELKRMNAKELSHSVLAERCGVEKGDAFYIAVGRNEIGHSKLTSSIVALQEPEREIAEYKPRLHRRATKSDDIQVNGVGSLLTQMANCCNPVPYDAIIGFITRGKGVTVHRSDCTNILNLRAHEQARLIDVDWGVATQADYDVNIELVAYSRPDLLRDIGVIAANEGVNISSMNTRSDDVELTSTMRMRMSVNSIEQLVTAMDKLKALRNVISVERLAN
jgi:GTP pyrophosphokinase